MKILRTGRLRELAQGIASALFVVYILSISKPAHALTCAAADSSGVVYAVEEPVDTCPGYLLLSAADHALLRNPFSTPPDFDLVVWSAGACMLLFAVGLGIGSVIVVIRKAR